MTFLFLYLGSMTVPGALLAAILGIRENRVGFAISFSLVASVLVLLVSRLAGLGTRGYGILLLVAVGLLLAAAWWRWRAGTLVLPRIRIAAVHVVAVVTLSSVAGYQLWAGPYLEVPADGWYHLGQISDRMDALADGDIGSIDSLRSLAAGEGRYWYTVVGFILLVSGAEIATGVAQLALANNLLFAAAIYAFALFLFGPLLRCRSTRHLAAAASVLFYFAHFGIGVFSFIRYYTFAPAFLNFVAYLAAIACIAILLRNGRLTFGPMVGFVLLAATTALVHFQEALFVLTVAGLMVGVAYVGSRWPSAIRGDWYRSGGNAPVRSRILGLVILSMVTFYALLHVFAYLSLDRHDPLAYGRMVDVHRYVPFLKDLYILKPDYQFYQAVTAWGMLVYLLFFLRIRTFLVSPYLVAGMLLPAVTVFNPLFTDFFLRFSNPSVLWRLCYAIPLSFVGAYFLVTCVNEIANGQRPVRRVVNAVVVTLLVVLLLPIQIGYFQSPYSKIAMLTPVEHGNDHRHWMDLVEYLGGRESDGVITDQVTGYVLNGMTAHDYRGYKFTGRYASHVREDRYDEDRFGPPDGWKKLVRGRDFVTKRPWLVVVNLRDGLPSRIGELGRHWPTHIMEVSRFYSRPFLEYVDRYPDMFQLIWEKDDIRVYEVGP